MAGLGYQKIGDLSDAKELRKLNDQLYLLWYKVLGRIEDKDIDQKNFSLELTHVEGGTMTVGGTTGGVIQIRSGSGSLFGTIDVTGIRIDTGKLITAKDSYESYLIGERNFCADHSFEYVAHDGAEDPADHDFVMAAPETGHDRWEIEMGNPRVLDDAACSMASQRYAWYGNQSIVCNSVNHVSYTTRIDASRNTYTVSAHAWPHYSRSAAKEVNARMRVSWMDESLTVIRDEDPATQLLTSGFSPSSSGRIYCGCRFAHTYERPDTARFIKLSLMSATEGGWVCYDGVQIAASDRMLIYQPEDGLWH